MAKYMAGIGQEIHEEFYQSEWSTKKFWKETFLTLSGTEYSVEGKRPLGF